MDGLDLDLLSRVLHGLFESGERYKVWTVSHNLARSRWSIVSVEWGFGVFWAHRHNIHSFTQDQRPIAPDQKLQETDCTRFACLWNLGQDSTVCLVQGLGQSPENFLNLFSINAGIQAL